MHRELGPDLEAQCQDRPVRHQHAGPFRRLAAQDGKAGSHAGRGWDALTDACVNVFVAAWLLKQKMVRHGNTWRAIGAYHSETPAQRDSYARSIQRVLVSWGELQPR